MNMPGKEHFKTNYTSEVTVCDHFVFHFYSHKQTGATKTGSSAVCFPSFCVLSLGQHRQS
jgi:hypothetical protein